MFSQRRSGRRRAQVDRREERPQRSDEEAARKGHLHRQSLQSPLPFNLHPTQYYLLVGFQRNSLRDPRFRRARRSLNVGLIEFRVQILTAERLQIQREYVKRSPNFEI